MHEVVEYNITDAAISEMENLYMGLTISHLESKDEFKAVHDARMIVKGKRVEVEKKRKELKADALTWGKKVDGKAKRIFGLLKPIETHLQTEEDKVLNEQKRIKAEEEAKEREKIEKRVNDLAEYRCILPFMEVSTMTDEEFDAALSNAKSEFETEEKRQAEAEATRKAEEERLAKQKAEQDAKEAELKKQADELAVKEKTIQDEKDRLEREAKEKQEAENARIQAEKDAEEKAEREAKERAEADQEKHKQLARQEALKPDREKLSAFAQYLQEGMQYPELKTDEGNEVLRSARVQIYDIGEEILVALEQL